jgi:cytochrome b involved in lipid metabolism
MKINELFEIIQKELDQDDLYGEFILHKNNIVWSYRLDDNEESYDEYYLDDDDFEPNFNFDCASNEELLQDAYIADSEKLESLLDEIEESDNWRLSEPTATRCVISFKILKK